MKFVTLALLGLVVAQDDNKAKEVEEKPVPCDTVKDCEGKTVEKKTGDDLACGSADWSGYKMSEKDETELKAEAKKAGKDGEKDYPAFKEAAIQKAKDELKATYGGKAGLCGPETYCGVSKADWNGVKMVCSKEMNGGTAVPDGGRKAAAKKAEEDKKKKEDEKKKAVINPRAPPRPFPPPSPPSSP